MDALTVDRYHKITGGRVRQILSEGDGGRLMINIEGNIGAGKSTVASCLRESLGDVLTVTPEPVEQWRNCGGHNILDLFYTDPKRHCYLFQSLVFFTRMFSTSHERGNHVVERSIHSDRIFAQLGKESGNMLPEEWEVYSKWYSRMSEDVSPDGFIYVRTSPEKCSSRMNTRNRPEEKGVPIDYLKKLHAKHEEWFPEGSTTDSYKTVPFVVIDMEEDMSVNEISRVSILALCELLEEIHASRQHHTKQQIN